MTFDKAMRKIAKLKKQELELDDTINEIGDTKIRNSSFESSDDNRIMYNIAMLSTMVDHAREIFAGTLSEKQMSEHLNHCVEQNVVHKLMLAQLYLKSKVKREIVREKIMALDSYVNTFPKGTHDEYKRIHIVNSLPDDLFEEDHEITT